MYLDPDFRKDAPKDRPYCVRCQKEIKDTSKAIKVNVNWETIQAEVSDNGTYLLGPDCFKIISQVPEGLF